MASTSASKSNASYSPVTLLLAIDKHLLEAKERANQLLAKAEYKAAAEAYEEALEWFRTLQRRANEALTGAKDIDRDKAAPSDIVEEVDDEASEISSKVLFYFKTYHCPPNKPTGHAFSTEDPLVRLLVTVVDEDIEGVLTVVSCSRQGARAELERDADEASYGIGPSIALTLLALRCNKAMAALRCCEWTLMPLDSAMMDTLSANNTENGSNLINDAEQKSPANGGHAQQRNEHIISRVVASGLVGALSTAIVEAEAAAAVCEQTAEYAKDLWADIRGVKINKTTLGVESSAALPLPFIGDEEGEGEGNERKETGDQQKKATDNEKDTRFTSFLETVIVQSLSLAIKATSRGARTMAMLADTEELQLLAYFLPEVAKTQNQNKSYSAAQSRDFLVSRAAVASSKRRYQFILKAWQKVREASARAQNIVDDTRAMLLAGESATEKEGEANSAKKTKREKEEVLDARLGPVLSALAHLKTTDSAKYRKLASGVVGSAFHALTPSASAPISDPSSSSSPASDNPLCANVAPFISRVHGVGLVATGTIEDGDCVLRERPIVTVSGSDFEERFSNAVSTLKSLAVRCRKALYEWWRRVEEQKRKTVAQGSTDFTEVAVLAKDVLPTLSNGFCVPPPPQSQQQQQSASFTTCTLPSPPFAFYLLLSVLSLHCDLAKDAAMFAGGGEDEGEQALSDEDLALCSIWHNNAMKISDVDFRIANTSSSSPDNGSGLYVVASRLNHSIRRINAVCIFDIPSGQLTVRALTKIPAGKEIFISYAPLIDSFLNQKKHLRFDVVREMQRKPVYNTEDGSIPEGKPKPDPTLLEAEKETGEDVLAPHLFGQELILCPKCEVEIEGKRVDESVTTLRCQVCDIDIPIASYYASVNKRRQEAAALCDVGSSPSDRTRAVKMLIGVEDGAKLLHKNHFLRSQIRLEALAAAVGAELSEDLSARLVHLSRLTAERITGLCPPSWPLTTGLKMHYVYCMGRHRIGTQRTEENDFVGLVAREAKLDPNRVSVKFEDEAPPVYTTDLIKESPDYVNRRLLRFIFLSMQDHVIQHGAEGAMASFVERYRPELESIGVRNADELEKCVKMAAFIVCR